MIEFTDSRIYTEDGTLLGYMWATTTGILYFVENKKALSSNELRQIADKLDELNDKT